MEEALIFIVKIKMMKQNKLNQMQIISQLPVLGLGRIERDKLKNFGN